MSRYVLRLWELAKAVQYSGGDCAECLSELRRELSVVTETVVGKPIYWIDQSDVVREQIDFMLSGGDWADDRLFDLHAGSLVESVARLLFGRTIPADCLIENPESMLAGFVFADREPSANGSEKPGFLDRANRRMKWDGKPYEWLTETMMDALELLLKRYPDKVKPSEMENKIGRLPADGFRKVFKTNRGGKTGVHPVAEIVGGRSPEGWYLIK